MILTLLVFQRGQIEGRRRRLKRHPGAPPSAATARRGGPRHAPPSSPPSPPAEGEPLVDLLAVRADREPLRVPAGHPHLAAQRDHRLALPRCRRSCPSARSARTARGPRRRGKVGPDVVLAGLCSGRTQLLTSGSLPGVGCPVSSGPGRPGRSPPGERAAGRRSTAARAAPARRRTRRTGSAGTTYQAPSSISAWSWPGPTRRSRQTRSETIPPASRLRRGVEVDQAEPGRRGRGSSGCQPTGSSGARHVGQGERAVRRDRAAA